MYCLGDYCKRIIDLQADSRSWYFPITKQYRRRKHEQSAISYSRNRVYLDWSRNIDNIPGFPLFLRIR
jgi:hypothetical protein